MVLNNSIWKTIAQRYSEFLFFTKRQQTFLNLSGITILSGSVTSIITTPVVENTCEEEGNIVANAYGGLRFLR